MPNIPREAKPLLDLIGNTEAPRGYDTIYGNNQNRLPTRLTRMTIGEVIEAGPSWARRFRSSAAGRYQFINKTLKGLKESLNISSSARFDADLQDYLAYVLLERRGFNRFMSGQLSVTAFGLNLAKEWASFPVLKDTRGARRQVRRGETYYASDGLNHALIKPETVERTLKSLRSFAADVSSAFGMGEDWGDGDERYQPTRDSEARDRPGREDRDDSDLSSADAGEAFEDLREALHTATDALDRLADLADVPDDDGHDEPFGIDWRRVISGRFGGSDRSGQRGTNGSRRTNRTSGGRRGGATGDARYVPRLVSYAGDRAKCAEILDLAKNKMVAIYGRRTLRNACACTLSLFLQKSGMDVKLEYGAGNIARVLERDRGWTRVAVGNQRPGDVGVCYDWDPTPPGSDHVYIVVESIDGDKMQIADNQKGSSPHVRYASGNGQTPTEYFLRAGRGGTAHPFGIDEEAGGDDDDAVIQHDQNTNGLVVSFHLDGTPL